jgi:hypothetical protein
MKMTKHFSQQQQQQQRIRSSMWSSMNMDGSQVQQQNAAVDDGDVLNHHCRLRNNSIKRRSIGPPHHRRPPVPHFSSSTTRIMILVLALLSATTTTTTNNGYVEASSSSPASSSSSLTTMITPTSTMDSVTPTSTMDSETVEQQQEQKRIQMVQQLLCDRLSYVLSGRRMVDFTHWVNNQPGGEAKVFSLHGVDVNFEMGEIKNMELEVDLYTPRLVTTKQRHQQLISQSNYHNNNKDPFLPDRMNLNFHRQGDVQGQQSLALPSSSSSATATEPQHIDKYYHGNVHEWDQNPPTPLQLALRAVKLSFVFGPVITTSWMALISKPFRRNIWYKWISNCLATSGAAFIK